MKETRINYTGKFEFIWGRRFGKGDLAWTPYNAKDFKTSLIGTPEEVKSFYKTKQTS